MNKIAREILRAGLADWVGLWEVAKLVRESDGDVSPDGLREAVIRLVYELQAANCVRLGFPMAAGSFIAWSLSPADAALRIRDEWQALGRDPTLGEIVWLENTPEGDGAARSPLSN